MSDPERPQRGGERPNFVDVSLRVAALALLIYVSYILVLPFVTVIVWSTILAVALYPFYGRVSKYLGGRNRLAAAVVTLLSFVIVLGPATWLVLDLISSIHEISQHLNLATLSIPAPPESIKEWPIVGPRLFQFLSRASGNIEAAVAEVMPLLKPLAGHLLSVAASAGVSTLMFFASIIVAGFLLVAGPVLIPRIRRLGLRLLPGRGDEFVDLAGDTIRTISRGVVGISALQALLAGLGLAVAGVPGVSLITSAVLILGIIQIGAGVVVVPVLIWVWFSLDTTTALLLTAYMVPVGLLDNVLRPLVMGRGLKTPILVILIGIIGGTLAYGITGVFLGPIILAVIWDLVAAWISDDGEPTAGAEAPPRSTASGN
jgi:predicted PurR-regulated permease PerM